MRETEGRIWGRSFAQVPVGKEKPPVPASMRNRAGLSEEPESLEKETPPRPEPHTVDLYGREEDSDSMSDRSVLVGLVVGIAIFVMLITWVSETGKRIAALEQTVISMQHDGKECHEWNGKVYCIVE